MIRKMGAALAIAAGAFAAVGVAAPAFAGTGDGNPQVGEVVLWKNTGFSGPLYDAPPALSSYPEGTTPLTFYNDATKLNDNASSIANYDTVNFVRAHINYNNEGAYIQLLPYGVTRPAQGTSYAYSSLGTFDNQLSSHEIAGS